ncbi:MAG: NAD(P)H-dependent oxidoreductase [Nocardioides sp.]|nr:NAD(P)H-dependent oxidoreductase [Nocardioides sp.]
MTKIAIVTGSVRPGRKSLEVAHWVQSIASKRSDATFEIVDIADFELPVWDEAVPPSVKPGGEKPHTKAWSDKIAAYDGYVFVVSEYNHSITGALKNALDHLKPELENKAAGFVSYGSVGGARAVEHLRGILSELQVAHVRNSVAM